MWYSQYSTELEKLCEEYENNNKFASTEATLSLNLYFIINAIKIGMGTLLKKHPQYKGPIDAMLHYLNGSGKPVKIDEKYVNQEFKGSILKKILSDHRDIKQNEVVSSVISYSNYGDKGDIGDHFKGGNINPLRYIIGGFTANIWYEVDENNIIHIYLKLEDIYNFKSSKNDGFILLHLGNLGLDSPKFIHIINKIIKYLEKQGIEGIKNMNNNLMINDYFWASLEKLGIAKPYKHYYEGEIATIYPNELSNHKTPEEKLNALSKILSQDIGNIPYIDNMSDLEYVIKNNLFNNYDKPYIFMSILNNYYPLSISYINNLEKLFNINEFDKRYIYNRELLDKILRSDNVELLSYLDKSFMHFIDDGYTPISSIREMGDLLHGRCLGYIRSKYNNDQEILDYLNNLAGGNLWEEDSNKLDAEL